MKSRSEARIEGLDGLRAVAVTSVVVFHAEPRWLPGGFLGVDVFFVLSGFLITRTLLRDGGDIDLLAFYRRRVQRLAPPLLLLAAVSIGAAVCWPDMLPGLRGDLPASLAYLANWHFVYEHVSYFQASGRPSPLQHLWSLAIEEQFYLLWPAAVVLLTRRVRRNRRTHGERSATTRLMVSSLLLAAASAAWMALLAVRGDVPYGQDSSRLYFGTDTHAQGLLVGAALAAYLTRARSRDWAPGNDALGLLGAAGLAWAMFRVDEFSPGLYRGGFLLVSLAAAAVIATIARQGSSVGRALEWGPLRWLGSRSYALYLWHWPLDVVTRPGLDLPWPPALILLLRLALPLLLAEVTHRLVEQRSPALRRRLARLAILPWRPVLLPTVALCVGVVLLAPQRSSAGTPTLDALPATGTTVRPSSVPASPPHSASPAASLPRPDAPVLAVGDSVMLGASPELTAAVSHLTVDAVVGRQARTTFSEITRDLAEARPGAVVIEIGNNGVVDPADLDRALAKLHGMRVVLLTVRVPRDWQDPNNALLRKESRRHPGVALVDWLAISAGHGSWFYDDGYHLRPDGAAAYATAVAHGLSLSQPLP